MEENKLKIINNIKDSKKYLINKDIMYSLEYYFINAKYKKYIAELAVYEEDKRIIIYPYLKKPIKEMEGYYDITTLEYGGEIGSYQDEKLFKNFRKEFNNYCKKNNIVTEFVRLSPFYNHFLEGTEVKDVYYINLKEIRTNLVESLKKNNRYSIKKAEREGVLINFGSDLKEFYDIYTKTMINKNAYGYYFYPIEYFEELISKFKENIKIFNAICDGKVIASSLFLYSRDKVYYYLSGNNKEYSSKCATNLLLWKAVNYFKFKSDIFILGGGVKQGDGLDKFKNSFTNFSKKFNIYKKIHNKEIYDKIIDSMHFPIWRKE